MQTAGFPSVELSPWFALVGPRGLNGEIVSKLNGEFKVALSDPAIAGRLEREQGFVISPSSPDELREQIQSEIGRMAELVRSAGLSKSK
jgi:tripartite-type tricarboxylate transporter receptor subunit TctC